MDDKDTTVCPACGAENDTTMGKLGKRVYTRCRSCGMDYSHEEERERERQARVQSAIYTAATAQGYHHD